MVCDSSSRKDGLSQGFKQLKSWTNLDQDEEKTLEDNARTLSSL